MSSYSNILVIDDNIDIGNIIKISLEKDGFNVIAFDSPLLAYEYFKSVPKKNSLVITDIRMPGMSGVELATEIKKLEPQTRIIFMTAFDIDDIYPELERFDYEIAKIFQKPLLIRNLRKIVKELLPSSANGQQ